MMIIARFSFTACPPAGGWRLLRVFRLIPSCSWTSFRNASPMMSTMLKKETGSTSSSTPWNSSSLSCSSSSSAPPRRRPRKMTLETTLPATHDCHRGTSPSGTRSSKFLLTPFAFDPRFSRVEVFQRVDDAQVNVRLSTTIFAAWIIEMNECFKKIKWRLERSHPHILANEWWMRSEPL